MRAAVAIAALGLLALTAAAGAQSLSHQDLSRHAPPPRGPYYIEYRARTGGILGHAYITYGRLDGAGRPLDQHYAGLYPDDEYEDALMTLGPLVVAPAHIRAERKDWVTPPSAVYRRTLDAQQYARLQLLLSRMRSDKLRWHLVFHSCNDFVGEIARDQGLIIPMAWGTPTHFINTLHALNGR